MERHTLLDEAMESGVIAEQLERMRNATSLKKSATETNETNSTSELNVTEEAKKARALFDQYWR